MRLDAQSCHQWSKLNQSIQDQLDCQSKVYLYPGLSYALYEICLGLHLKYSHKRKIVKQLGFGSHLQKIEIEMAKLGVRFKDSFEDEIAKEEKACLAYIHDIDDAVTGELYDHIETLKFVSASKIIRIHVAHHLLSIRKNFIKNLSEYDIVVGSLGPNHTLVFTGDKVSISTLGVGELSWNYERDWPMISELIKNEVTPSQTLIEEFENSLPPQLTPWFPKGRSKRIFDRSVVVLKDGDGSAFVDLLYEELNLEKKWPGDNQALESVSYCRWQNESWFKQSQSFDRTPEELRGLVLIDSSIINSTLMESINVVIQKMIQLSE